MKLMKLNGYVKWGDIKLLKYILNNKITYIYEDYSRILQGACCSGKINIIKCLFEYLEKNEKTFNIYIDSEYSIYYACKYGFVNIIKYLMNYTENNSIITIKPKEQIDGLFKQAFECGHIELVEYLLEYGYQTNNMIDIHSTDEYAFRWACTNNHLNVMKYLIGYGETMNTQINIYKKNDQVFRKHIDKNIREYLIYLSKHNYNNKYTYHRNITYIYVYNNILIDNVYIIKSDNYCVEIEH